MADNGLAGRVVDLLDEIGDSSQVALRETGAELDAVEQFQRLFDRRQ
ncbi:MAG: hypothetical protein V3U46_09705 [Acidimicrobiia bacterium]